MALRKNTKPRYAFSYGLTIPLEREDGEKSFASLRVESSYEDSLRADDRGSLSGLRQRVRRTVFADIDKAVRQAFTRHGLTKDGRIPNQRRATWVP